MEKDINTDHTTKEPAKLMHRIVQGALTSTAPATAELMVFSLTEWAGTEYTGSKADAGMQTEAVQ